MNRTYSPLATRFFRRDARNVARDLLGAYLVSDCGGARCVGRVIETEAYPGPHDPASHAAARVGRTARNDPMFGPPGTAYVHLNYGIHWCLNVVVGAEGHPAAVLIRSLEPVEGLETMRRRRRRREDRQLCSGPAKLTQALGIGPAFQRAPLDVEPLLLAAGDPVPSGAVVRATRVGITRGRDRKWRYYDRRSACISRRA